MIRILKMLKILIKSLINIIKISISSIKGLSESLAEIDKLIEIKHRQRKK